MDWLNHNIEDESSGLVPASELDDQDGIGVVDSDDAGELYGPADASDESDIGASGMRESIYLRDEDEDDDVDYLDDEDDEDDDDYDDDLDDDDYDDDLDDDDLDDDLDDDDDL